MTKYIKSFIRWLDAEPGRIPTAGFVVSIVLLLTFVSIVSGDYWLIPRILLSALITFLLIAGIIGAILSLILGLHKIWTKIVAWAKKDVV